MLETMLALKNNDMRKIPGYDPEPVERLRKLQRTLVGESHIYCKLRLLSLSLTMVIILLISTYTTRWLHCVTYVIPN